MSYAQNSFFWRLCLTLWGWLKGVYTESVLGHLIGGFCAWLGRKWEGSFLVHLFYDEGRLSLAWGASCTCRGLEWAQVGQALDLFKDAGVYPDVYRDGDGDTPEELRRARPVPREQFQPPEEKSGMTFGKTVLAVVVGIIAAVLILAFL